MCRGKVKWFDKKKGYGFLVIEDGMEIFVHYSGLNMEGFKTLEPGQTVVFGLIETEKGLQAINVVIEDEDKEGK